jgi:hypothetical protein
MCLLFIVAGVTLLNSGVYYSLKRPPVYTTIAVVIGLGILWALVTGREKPDVPDDTKIAPED